MSGWSRRTVIVGGGSAGCVLAARLSEDPNHHVVLIEDGDWLPSRSGVNFSDPGQSETRSAGAGSLAMGSLAMAFDPERSSTWGVNAGDHQLQIRGGRSVGGSSAVNGCYFMRATAGDLRKWTQLAGPGFSPAELVRQYAVAETDLDFGGAPGHGDSGPVPVERDDADLHPVSRAFLAAASELGVPYRTDLNAEPHVVTADPNRSETWATASIGPVPFNARDGFRADIATCYLGRADGHPGRRNLEILTRSRATRVLFRGHSVTGVEVLGPERREVVAADRVVISAGAIGSPALLLASGAGPAEPLLAAGIEPVVDLPGVGANLFNHPTFDVSYMPVDAVVDPRFNEPTTSFMQLVLHAYTGTPLYGAERSAPALAEIMATRRPYGQVTSQQPDDRSLSLRVTLMNPATRGTVALSPARSGAAVGSPGIGPGEGVGVAISHDPMADQRDLDAMRFSARLADELLRSPQFEPLVEHRVGLTEVDLANDEALKRWLRSNVSFAFHQMGTCAMGPIDPTDRTNRGEAHLAVVDPGFNVIGLDGLSVVDASVIPVPLSRGPAATVVALAEMAAGRMVAE